MVTSHDFHLLSLKNHQENNQLEYRVSVLLVFHLYDVNNSQFLGTFQLLLTFQYHGEFAGLIAHIPKVSYLLQNTLIFLLILPQSYHTLLTSDLFLLHIHKLDKLYMSYNFLVFFLLRDQLH